MRKIKVDKEKNQVKILVNPKLYTYCEILKTAQDFSEDRWVNVDGNPPEFLEITIKPKRVKDKEIKDLEKIGLEFYNNLLSNVRRGNIRQRR